MRDDSTSFPYVRKNINNKITFNLINRMTSQQSPQSSTHLWRRWRPYVRHASWPSLVDSAVRTARQASLEHSSANDVPLTHTGCQLWRAVESNKLPPWPPLCTCGEETRMGQIQSERQDCLTYKNADRVRLICISSRSADKINLHSCIHFVYWISRSYPWYKLQRTDSPTWFMCKLNKHERVKRDSLVDYKL